MSDNANNLSFSSEFNYRKIVLNSSSTVTVPATASAPNYNTVLTVDTTLTYVPTAEVMFSYNGNYNYGNGLVAGPSNMAVWFELSGTTYVMKVGFQGDGSSYANTVIYYRVYLDGNA